MDLDPGIRTYIRQVEAACADLGEDASLAQQRARYEAVCRSYARPRSAHLSVSDRTIAGPAGPVPVRLYHPRPQQRLPAILFLHGGGWVLGSIESHDTVTAELAAETGAAVVSVGYRLAPEHPFPAALEDGYAALLELASDPAAWGVDAGRIAVTGDSAGGNLATAITLLARERKGPRLAGQALIYPALGVDFDLPSYSENAERPFLTRDAMMSFWRLYLGGGADRASALSTPLQAPDLAGLPPAFITTAKYDPVRDDGALYAQRLAAAGVPATYRCAPRLIHGWLRARGMSGDADTEFRALCDALCAFLAGAAAAA